MIELWFWLRLPYVLTFCFVIGFVAVLCEPPKPVYHWKEMT